MLSCAAAAGSPLPRPSPAHECWTLSTVSSFSCSSPGTRLSVSSSKLSSKDTAGGTSGPYLQAPSTALPPARPVLAAGTRNRQGCARPRGCGYAGPYLWLWMKPLYSVSGSMAWMAPAISWCMASMSSCTRLLML